MRGNNLRFSGGKRCAGALLHNKAINCVIDGFEALAVFRLALEIDDLYHVRAVKV